LPGYAVKPIKSHENGQKQPLEPLGIKIASYFPTPGQPVVDFGHCLLRLDAAGINPAP
jgi:hypothetical protein